MGAKTTIKWDQKAIDTVHDRPQKSLIAIGLEMEGDIKRSFTSGAVKHSSKRQQQATGSIYKRKGKERTASAPGQPPAVDTGRLRASITTNWTGSNQNRASIKQPVPTSTESDGVGNPGGNKEEFKVVVGSNVVYARPLELGNPRKHLLPRPYLTPIFEKFRTQIMQKLKNTATGRIATE